MAATGMWRTCVVAIFVHGVGAPVGMWLFTQGALTFFEAPSGRHLSPVGVSASPFEPMLIDAQSILLAAAAPGAVVAPKWLLPTAAACVAVTYSREEMDSKASM